MKILVTGSAGFIGFHLVKALLQRGDEVIGLDNLNDYYDVNLKYARLTETGIRREDICYDRAVKSSTFPTYQFIKLDLIDKKQLEAFFQIHQFDAVCHLAAQAGVRYSLTNPQAYLDSNVQGFLNILECCRQSKIRNFVYASSSSVYGLNKRMPFSTHDNVDHPISLYAASKKSNELMAHTYSYLFNIPTTALRFFTVYGPWGRPDMAIFLFTKAILEGKPIQIFNNGDMSRDFTYVDDIVNGVLCVVDNPAKGNLNWDNQNPDPASSSTPYRVLNIGRGKPVQLLHFVEQIESSLGILAKREYLPLQEGDVKETWANIEDMEKDFQYQPKTEVTEGVPRFVKWYKEYYESSSSLCSAEIKDKP